MSAGVCACGAAGVDEARFWRVSAKLVGSVGVRVGVCCRRWRAVGGGADFCLSRFAALRLSEPAAIGRRCVFWPFSFFFLCCRYVFYPFFFPSPSSRRRRRRRRRGGDRLSGRRRGGLLLFSVRGFGRGDDGDGAAVKKKRQKGVEKKGLKIFFWRRFASATMRPTMTTTARTVDRVSIFFCYFFSRLMLCLCTVAGGGRWPLGACRARVRRRRDPFSFFLGLLSLSARWGSARSSLPRQRERLEIFFACRCARRSKKRVGGRCQGRATRQASDLPTAARRRRVLKEQASANGRTEQEA